MATDTQRVRVEELDWSTVLPFSRLFGAFQMAVRPTVLLTSLLLVSVLWVGGHAADRLCGPGAYPREVRQFGNLPIKEYDRWVESLRFEEVTKTGVYAAAATFKLEALDRLVHAAARLDFGFGELLGTHPGSRHTVVAALRDILITLPWWLWHSHRWFLILYGIAALPVWALLGGMLARMAALHATRNERPTWDEAFKVARSQWAWFLITPLMPLLLAMLIAVVPALGGLVFFNLPVLDMIGGLTFVVPLLCGAAITALLILLVTGGPLLYPALAVEGTDGFDAISRVFGYVLGRPWRWLLYSLTALVYGAITYLFVGLIVSLTVWVTQRSVGLGVFREAEPGLSLFDVILAPPRFGQYPAQTQWESLSATGKVAACLTRLWVGGVMLLLWAYAVSYYVCASTWVYLLLRRSADGTEFDDVYNDATGHHPPAGPPGGETDTGGEAPALASQIEQVAVAEKDSDSGDTAS